VSFGVKSSRFVRALFHACRARSRADSRAVVRVVSCAVHALFRTVSRVVTRRVRASRVPFTRVACLAARR
jgi:hypothetical protein